MTRRKRKFKPEPRYVCAGCHRRIKGVVTTKTPCVEGEHWHEPCMALADAAGAFTPAAVKRRLEAARTKQMALAL